MKTKITEIYNYFMRPEFKDWKIFRHDGKYTDVFNPFTLIESFLECEMDLYFAFQLFDQVVEKISPLTQTGPITYDQIHTTVAACLIGSDNKDAKNWLSNYDNIFGPDLERLALEEGYVVVRYASELKSKILQILLQMSGRSSEKELEKYLGVAELREMTNRVIKIIRYCGFYIVKESFLKDFIEELAKSSIKGMIPTVVCDNETVLYELDEAEKYLLMAREEGHHEREIQCENLLEISLETMGAIALKKFGLLPFSTTRKSFYQFCSILKTICKLAKSSRHLNFIIDSKREEIINSMVSQKFSVETFIGECDVILYCIENKYFLRACWYASKILRNLRIILLPDKSLAKLYAYEYYDKSKEEYFKIVYDIFDNSRMQPYLSEDCTLLEIDIDFNYHELIEFGRRIRFRYKFTKEEQNFPIEWLNSSIEDLESKRDVISVIVTNTDIDPSIFSKIERIVSKNKRCFTIVKREDFEKVLRNPEEIRDLVIKNFEMQIPIAKSLRGKIFPEEKPFLPSNIREYERNRIEEAYRNVSNNLGLDACQKASTLFEFVIREQILFICAILKHGIKKKLNLTGIYIEPNQKGMHYYIEWFNNIIKNTRNRLDVRNIIGEFLPTRNIINELVELSKIRNIYMHLEREIEENEAKLFLSRITNIFSKIQDQTHKFKRAIFIKSEKKQMIFYTLSGLKAVNGRQLHAPDTHLEKGCCVYLNEKESFFSIIHALTFCEECFNISLLDRCEPNGKGKCSICGSKIDLERAWHSLLKKADNFFKNKENTSHILELKNNAREKMNDSNSKNKNGENSVSPRPKKWLRAISETVAGAVGPLGAPLKGLMAIQDLQKEEELDRKLEELLKGQKEIKAKIFEDFFPPQKDIEKVIEILSISIAKYLNMYSIEYNNLEELYKKVEDSNSWPFVSITNIQEKVLKEELYKIYELNIDLLFSDLTQLGYPVSRIKITGTPEIDILNFIISLRRQSLSLLLSIFGYLSQKYPSSEIFSQIVSQLSIIAKSGYLKK